MGVRERSFMEDCNTHRPEAYATWGGSDVLVFFDDLFEVVAEGGEGLADDLHLAVSVFADDVVEGAEVVGLVGEVFAELGAAGFLAFDGRAGDGFGDGEEVGQVEGGVPAGVVFADGGGAGFGGASLELGEAVEGAGHFVFLADDADEVLHHVLEGVLDLVGGFAGGASVEWGECGLHRRINGGLVDFDLAVVLGELGGVFAGSLAEDDEVGEGVAAEAVGAVEARGDLARGEEAGDGGHLRIAIDLDAAHDVVGGGADFHGFLGDIDAGEGDELVVHGGELLLDVLLAVLQFGLDPGDVEEHAAVRAAAAGFDFSIDAAGDVVAGEEFGRAACGLVAGDVARAFLFGICGGGFVVLGDVIEHEPLALVVAEDAALAADAFGDQDAADGGGPD